MRKNHILFDEMYFQIEFIDRHIVFRLKPCRTTWKMAGGIRGRDIFQNRTTRHVGRRVSRLPSGPGGHSRPRLSTRMRIASDSGNVTTYRPEHVVNRADRDPVAVGPQQRFDNEGCEAVTN